MLNKLTDKNEQANQNKMTISYKIANLKTNKIEFKWKKCNF